MFSKEQEETKLLRKIPRTDKFNPSEMKNVR